MNVFVIPSWYPSGAFPFTGIFFREQAELIANNRPDWNVGISLWGSHEPGLWLRATTPLTSLIKATSRFPLKSRDNQLSPNCAEFFTPAHTWSRRVLRGNIGGIVDANRRNMRRFTEHFGAPDVIHAHVVYPAGTIAMALSGELGVPYLITEHMSPFPMRSFKGDFRKILLPPLRRADKVLAIGSALRMRLEGFGIQAEITGNFIDDSFFMPSAGERRPVFTFVANGRLEDQKNYPLLLAAVAKLKERRPDFLVKVVGGGTLGKSLKKLAQRLSVAEHVEWQGECTRAQVRDVLRAGDAFINTSKHENQPVSILEALACGLPVITTDWAGAADVITDGMGATMPANADVLAQAMEDFMDKLPGTKSELRKKFESHYGTGLQISRLEAHYREILR